MTTEVDELAGQLEEMLANRDDLRRDRYGATLPRERSRKGITEGGSLKLIGPQALDTELLSTAALALSETMPKGGAEMAALQGEIVRQLINAHSRQHFGISVDREGHIALVPDQDGLKLLALAWRLLDRPTFKRPSLRLCAQCHRLMAPKREDAEYCSTRCRVRASDQRKAAAKRAALEVTQ
jgi:hypothetical protein